MIVISGIATDGNEGSGGAGTDWTRLLTPGVLITALVVLLVLGVVVAIFAWVAVRRLRRSSTLRTQILALKAATGDGPTRRVAQLRLELQRALDATQRSLAAAQEADQPVGELPGILSTLVRTGALLDRQLRLAESDPDPESSKSAAEDLAPQVRQLVDTAAGVRRSTAQANAALTSAALEPLHGQLATEAEALRTWTETYARLGRA